MGKIIYGEGDAYKYVSCDGVCRRKEECVSLEHALSKALADIDTFSNVPEAILFDDRVFMDTFAIFKHFKLLGADMLGYIRRAEYAL